MGKQMLESGYNHIKRFRFIADVAPLQIIFGQIV